MNIKWSTMARQIPNSNSSFIHLFNSKLQSTIFLISLTHSHSLYFLVLFYRSGHFHFHFFYFQFQFHYLLQIKRSNQTQILKKEKRRKYAIEFSTSHRFACFGARNHSCTCSGGMYCNYHICLLFFMKE